ncbi:acyltransferase family protein [Nocardioides pantholopis]|uniref:acyltransferase family protein n=1 Tax=Nocardioides pantholopis TaxID=2483798 RepID=UPI0013DE6A22|nr:acyltransferase family protein [Nocardioides pantholopis]
MRPGDSASAPTYRPDIEGLRAIAIGTVLLYHAGLPWVPGGFVGVDVFFVISGFLITSLMVREVDRTGRISLPAFWARRARRLLPAGTLVLAFCAVLTWLVLPVTSRREFGGDIVSAATYVVNWRLAYREVDYLNADLGPSPVQHFWSLAVEEQFYLVWPCLLAALVLLARARWRAAAVALLTLVTISSFAFAVYYAEVQPGLAFFVSTTRAWELGVGALLALGLPRLQQLRGALRALLGWVGLAAIAAAALVLDDATTWPGTATALPVLGTAALILAGAGPASRAVPWGPHRLLGIAPAVWIGGLSYSIYLWHWPFVVAADALAGEHRIRWTVLAAVLSLIPAWLSYTFVENPIRRGRLVRSTRAALSMGLVVSAASAVAGAAVITSVTLASPVDRASAGEAPGAAALLERDAQRTRWSQVRSVDSMRPSPLDDAVSDTPAVYTETDCIVGLTDSEVRRCELGDVDSERTIALVGDSKAAQWTGPVDALARGAGWRVLLMVKNGCTFANAPTLHQGKPKPSCNEWREQVIDELIELQPDYVLTSTRADDALPPGGETEEDATFDALVDGLSDYWSTLEDSGVPVLAILDNPSPGLQVTECIADNLDNLTACTFPKQTGIQRSGAPAQRAAAERVPGVELLDLTDTVCPDEDTCPPLVGNVMVYRSGSHVGNTYAMTAQRQLAEALWAATDGDLGTAPANRAAPAGSDS